MAKLKKDKEFYTISAYYTIHPFTRKEMEAEYSRLSKIANRNLERIARSEFSEDQFYKYFYGRFIPISDIQDERELAYRLSDLAKFISSDKATYSGAREQRRKAVRSMKISGYGFVTYKNYQKFADFMAAVKTSYGEHLYDSERVVEWYEENRNSEVSPEQLLEDFSVWENGQSNLY